MKAFVKTGSQTGEAGVKDVPLTWPGPKEALLRVASCGLCGSDVHAFRSHAGFEWVRTPVTLGHEFSGIVEAIGPGVTRVKAREIGWLRSRYRAVAAAQPVAPV